MVNIIIRILDDLAAVALRARAKRNGHSLEEELRQDVKREKEQLIAEHMELLKTLGTRKEIDIPDSEVDWYIASPLVGGARTWNLRMGSKPLSPKRQECFAARSAGCSWRGRFSRWEQADSGGPKRSSAGIA
ncbi:FitA-like ribbon-helix-helix domain-containing protein [Fimbriiglobus ruber]|uniref:FitA-like ribbon-helix-helix domain-containing protein n=1 Tax=Fimbriiglobus ruber TaxID=1908690 RepID=UPI003B845776